MHVLTNYVSVLVLVVKGVVLVPLYLRAFGLDAYGAWLASGNVLSIIGVVESGFTVVYAQRLAAAFGARDDSRFGRVLGSGGAMLSATALVIAVGAVVMSRWVPEIVRVPAPVARGLQLSFGLAGIGAGLALIQTVIFSAFYAWQRAYVVGVVRFVAQLVEIVAVVVGLYSGFGLVALGGATVVGGVVGLVAAALAAFHTLGATNRSLVRIDRNEIRSLAAETLPMFASRAASVLVNNNEPLIISVLLGPAQAAILGITDRVYKVGQMLVNPVAGSAFYGLAHLAAEDRTGARVREVVAEVLGLAAIFAVAIFGLAAALNAPFVALWVGADKFGGATLNILLAAAALLTVRGNLLGMVLSGLGEARRATGCSLIELGLRFPLIFLLLPPLGMAGLPLATLCSGLVVAAWPFARALSARLTVRGHAAVALTLRGLPASAVGLTFAAVTSIYARHLDSWPRFTLGAAVSGLTCGLLLLALQPRFRTLLGQMIRRLRGAPMQPDNLPMPNTSVADRRGNP